MLKHKQIERICWMLALVAVMIVGVYLLASSRGWIREKQTLGYMERLFDTTLVHTIDIQMEDWDSFLDTCINEEYVSCDLIIDDETYRNVGIRAKGNTSLTSVAAYGNDRYSFKIEFDQYNSGNTYYGLDKLSLNNLIQDNTCLKDYLCYTMMNDMGVAAPLCSFVYITVNGEDWGLYLAVEGVEEAFLQRNYGNDYGELYKPDSTGLGGGRGNGQGFVLNEAMDTFSTEEQTYSAMNMVPPDSPDMDSTADGGDMQPGPMGTPTDRVVEENGEETNKPAPHERDWSQNGGRGGGMNQADVMLQYIDDDPSSYANIFDNAKTDSSDADQARLIASLKALSEGDSSVVDIDAVLRYLVVHNFVCNGDSYTGSMVHNYYLYEENGVLSMIPWDYNLAFGAFSQGELGSAMERDQATVQVNLPIDSPVSDGDLASRPMVAWIFENSAYTEQYHQYYQQFITEYFDQGVFIQKLDTVIQLISPYVEKDPTAFCTYEDFLIAVDTLREFCLLRAESISGQLDGMIPSTDEGQSKDASSLIDASHISLSDMGSMGIGGHGGDVPFLDSTEQMRVPFDAQQGVMDVPESGSDWVAEKNETESPSGTELEENEQLDETAGVSLDNNLNTEILGSDFADSLKEQGSINLPMENGGSTYNIPQPLNQAMQGTEEMTHQQLIFGNAEENTQPPATNRTLLFWLILSVGALAVGLLVVFLWKH